MAIASGTRFGAYEVTDQIGVGGMGEVYRARDTNLKRDVAIKVLPPSLWSDPDRLARFRREAELLASLNHVNIAQIHGLERSSEGVMALAMELVDGATLAERIAQGPIPLEEALDIANQIAAGLEAAHERGIVHRDLKPANIKVKPDGTVKVLDFGIAKALDTRVTSGPQSPAITTPAMTEAGVVLGTAAYMSPEQARGKPVDQRADIWAFGCVLYEMLTGQLAFGGDDGTIVLARVLERPTDLGALPTSISPAVRRTIELCLEKDPRKRIAHISDVILALAGRFDTATRPPAAAVARLGSRPALAIGATSAVAALVAAGVIAWSLWPAPVRQPVNRFAYQLPEDQTILDVSQRPVAVSPDGRRFAYHTAQGIFVRALGDLEARFVQGTDNSSRGPMFAPDGQAIAYFDAVQNKLLRIALSGGTPVVIADALNVISVAHWQRDGTILFTTQEGVLRVPAMGGKPELLLPARNRELLFGPALLPDGDSLLFAAIPDGNIPDSARIVVESLATGERSVLIESGWDARYVPTGHLVYTVGNTQFAIAFDRERLSVSGAPVPIEQGLVRGAGGYTMGYAFADDGTLVYVKGDSVASRRTLVWVDRDGREQPIAAPPRAYVYAALSPDGTHVALDIRDQESDIWILDLGREGVLQRLTFDAGVNRHPVWAPDGQRLAFTRLVSREEIHWQAWDGAGMPEPLTAGSADNMLASDFSGDGSVLLAIDQTAPREIWTVPVVAGQASTATPLLLAGDGGALSPDGRWLAYESVEAGRREIYVRPFPAIHTGQWQISTAGGSRPHWSREGRELVYLAPGSNGAVAVMAVPVESSARFTWSTPQRLFEGEYATPQQGRHAFDVSRDGERFIMIKNAEGSDSLRQAQIIVVQNWFEELERVVSTK